MTEVPCICIFSALYLPSMGGVETYTFNLARTLAEQGNRVIIVTLNTHQQEDRTCEDGIHILRLPCHSFLNNRYPLAQKNKTYHRLWRWLQSQQISYIVVNSRFYPHSYQGLSFAQAQGITPVLIEHGSAHLTMGNFIIDLGVQAIEHILTKAERHFKAAPYAVSNKASLWLSHFNLKSRGELSNSIDADSYAACASSRNFRSELDLPADTFIVAFAGRLVGEKGILELAQAVKSLNTTKHIAVLAAGDGPLRETLQTYESERFFTLGMTSKNDVAALLMQANIMCLPSRSEGFATSLLEAAACYTPAIITDVGGVDELIPTKEYGTVIPNQKPQTIQEALEEAVQNIQHTKEQGKRVGERVRTLYSWDKTARDALEACQQAQQ